MSIVECLRGHAVSQPGATAFSFYSKGNSSPCSSTYADLYARVRQFSGWLSDQGVSGRALILMPDSKQFIEVFLACLASGVTAVPMVVPHPKKPFEGLTNIIDNAKVSCVITLPDIAARVSRECGSNPKLRYLYPQDVGDDGSAQPHLVNPDPHSLAFIQYTSGSTGSPKGVMVSHANLMANEALIQEAMQLNKESVVVNWLPLFHDMGLIGGMLQPLYSGAHCVVMEPMMFLQKPLRWLQAVSDYQASTTGGPNFAYELCVRRTLEQDCKYLDLSSLKVAFCGSEPIRAATIRAFCRKFSPYGFDANAFYACYGLAEHTLFVSGGKPGSGSNHLTVKTQALNESDIVPVDHQVTAEHNEQTTELVSCGQVSGGVELRIVDPVRRESLPDNQVGEIWLRSSSVAGGYWGQPELSRAIFSATLKDDDKSSLFLRTGDLAFLRDGHLYLCGRNKDLIIIRGRNYYPQDIEACVQNENTELVFGGGAAFGIDRDGEEVLVLVQELNRAAWRQDNRSHLIQSIKQAVAHQFSLTLTECRLVKPGTLVRTTSGKIKRTLSKQQFMQGLFDDAVHSPTKQLNYIKSLTHNDKLAVGEKV